MLRLTNYHRSSTYQGFLALADQAVVNATNYLTGIIVARTCSEGQFGLYMLGLTIVFVATELQKALISTPYSIYYHRLEAGLQPQYTGSTMIQLTLLAAVASIGFICLGEVFSILSGLEDLRRIVFVLSTVIAFILLRENVRQICFAWLNVHAALAVDISVAVFQIGGLMFLLKGEDLSAARVFWAVGLGSAVGGLGWLALNRHEVQLEQKRILPHIWQNWAFGKWTFGSSALWAISTNTYPWLLAGLYGPGVTGVFAACQGTVALANPIIYGLGNLVGPKIAHVYASKGEMELRRYVGKSVALFLGAVGGFSVFFLALGGQLTTALFGYKYGGNNLIISILAVNILCSGLQFVFSRALFTVERADLDFKINVGAILILVFVGFWLVVLFGILGAAIGLLVTNVSTLLVRYTAFNRQMGRSAPATSPSHL